MGRAPVKKPKRSPNKTGMGGGTNRKKTTGKTQAQMER